tara:strand:- start:639 stop:1361 length:723 start_codon:yes stop_codon:yes gene_type:complete
VGVSDNHLRELEATWRASASVEDEAAYLVERVRVGELKQSRLELTASLGFPSALLAVPSVPVATDSQALLELIAQRGDPVLIRGLLGLGYAALPTWKEEQPQSEEPEALFALTEAWLVGLSPDFCQRAAGRWGNATNMMLQVDGGASQQASVAYLTCLQAVSTAMWASGWVEGTDPEEARIKKLERAAACVEAATCVAASPLSEDLARAAIATELVPWALGYSDPVRERVEARQREATGE